MRVELPMELPSPLLFAENLLRSSSFFLRPGSHYTSIVSKQILGRNNTRT